MSRNCAFSLVAVLALFVLSAAGAGAATMDYLGTWNSTTTYAVGKVVKYNGGITKRTTPLRTVQHQALTLTLRHPTGIMHHDLENWLRK